MVNYFIYAKDYSGSTSAETYYHENGLKTVELFKNDVETLRASEEHQIVYLRWGFDCEQVDEDVTIDDYKNKRGDGGGTYPENIIHWIKKHVKEDDKIKLLYIITDGCIPSTCLNECLELNQGVNYEKVYFHAINKRVNEIDLSVAASFFKSHCIIYRNKEKFDETDISQEFDYATITVDNFDTEKNNLKSYIKLKYLNSSKQDAAALIEIEQLTQLRNRLFNSVPREFSSSGRINLETKDKNTFIQAFKQTNWYLNLTNTSYTLQKQIEKSISTLINYIVSEKKSYAFDALKFETKYSEEVAEEQLVDVNFATEQEIEFPDIILDDEKGIPVILFTELDLLKRLILNPSKSRNTRRLIKPSTACFSKFKATMECPLFLFNDPRLNDSVGYFYTVNVYKQLITKTRKTEPRTRRPFQGGLVLVDTDDFDAYNDYIIAATYFNKKKVKYNIGLFYFLLWKICEKKEWMDRNVVEQFKKYMLRRVKNTVCKIALSSLPLDAQVKTSLPSALWYCVELSSDIFKSDPDNFVHERLRMYHGVAPHMVEILKYLGYDLDPEYLRKRPDMVRHVMLLKKIPAPRDKMFYIMDTIFKSVNGFLVCKIKNQGNVRKLNYLKLYHKEMLKDDVVSEDVNLNDYVHFLHQIDDSSVQICETTFRPYFMIDENKSFYSVLYENGKQVVVNKVNGKIKLKHESLDKFEYSRFLSYHNLFVECVKDTEKFPSFTEYTDYILKKKKFKKNLVTIFPVDVFDCIKRVFKAYTKVVKGVAVSTFIFECNKYASRVERIKAENKRKFEDDKDILEFIEKEEMKVKKVKKEMKVKTQSS